MTDLIERLIKSVMEATVCPTCHGTKEVTRQPCYNCAGTGRMVHESNIKLAINAAFTIHAIESPPLPGVTQEQIEDKDEPKYRAEVCRQPLGDTGDYDEWIELVTPDFNLQCYDPKVDLSEVQELADKLNSTLPVPTRLTDEAIVEIITDECINDPAYEGWATGDKKMITRFLTDKILESVPMYIMPKTILLVIRKCLTARDHYQNPKP